MTVATPGWYRKLIGLGIGVLSILLVVNWPSHAASEGGNSFNATFTDTEGLRTDVTNLSFYWEEKISETQLALHELKHVPAKRGAVPIQIQFDKIKQIEFTASADQGEPIISITLKNGKKGNFTLEIPGSFKGQTDFGEMIARPSHLKRIVFK